MPVKATNGAAIAAIKAAQPTMSPILPRVKSRVLITLIVSPSFPSP